MSIPPTPTEKQVLEVLAVGEASARPPTYRELATSLGWRSVGTARAHVASLVHKGLVCHPEGRARSLRLTVRGAAAVAGPVCAGEPRVEETAAGALVARLQPWMELRVLPAGHVLWAEGEAPRMAVLLESGRVRTSCTRPSGRRVPYYDFHPGDLFGLLPLVDGAPYPADAEVLEAAHARVMTQAALSQALATDPGLARLLLESLGRRLREALDRVRDASEHDTLPRLARAILHRSAEAPHGGVVHLGPTAADLAEELGVTAPTLSRALTRLVRLGAVHRLGPRSVQIRSFELLRRCAAPADL